MRERPIPNIGSDDDNVENIVIQPEPIIEKENDQNVPNTSNGNSENMLPPFDELFCDQATENSGQNNQEEPNNVEIEHVLVENQESAFIDENSVCIKEETIDPIAITEGDAAELNRIIGEANESLSPDENGDLDTPVENDDYNSDDNAIIWVDLNTVFPKPAKCTEDVMPKRENDRISGNLPFSEKVSFLLSTLILQDIGYSKQILIFIISYRIFIIHRKMVIVFIRWEKITFNCQKPWLINFWLG